MFCTVGLHLHQKVGLLVSNFVLLVLGGDTSQNLLFFPSKAKLMSMLLLCTIIFLTPLFILVFFPLISSWLQVN